MAKHVVIGGKVNIYKRENSEHWQCAIFMNGKNRRKSTKTDSLEQAKEIAEDWYLELKGKKRAGVLTSDRTFKQAAEQFRREYEVITEGQRNATYVKGHWTRLDNYLIPFFGKMGLSGDHGRRGPGVPHPSP